MIQANYKNETSNENNSFAIIDQEYVKTKMEYNDIVPMLFLYDQFLINRMSINVVCVDQLCYELGYDNKSRNIEYSDSSKFMNYYKNLIETNRIKLLDQKSINDISKKTVFRIQYQNMMPNRFVVLSYNELIKLLQIASTTKYKLHNLLNVFLAIKSHICMDENVLQCTYVSLNSICKILNIKNNKIVSDIIGLFIKYQLIYEYNFTDNQIQTYSGSGYHSINTIWSLKEYLPEQIVQYFKRY